MRVVCRAFRGVGLLDIMLLSRYKAATGRRGYPAEFRRRVLDLLTEGRKVVDLARDLGVSEQTICTWRRSTAGSSRA